VVCAAAEDQATIVAANEHAVVQDKPVKFEPMMENTNGRELPRANLFARPTPCNPCATDKTGAPSLPDHAGSPHTATVTSAMVPTSNGPREQNRETMSARPSNEKARAVRPFES